MKMLMGADFVLLIACEDRKGIVAAVANSIRGGKTVAVGAYIVVVGYSALAALEQIGARPAFVLSAGQILLGSLGLALAIACGWGAKDIAAERLRELLKKNG